MKYIRVENNEPVGNPQDLPICWENVTNFYLLSDEKLKQYGWYPFIIEELILNENEIFLGWALSFENDTVIKKANKRILTAEEILHKEQVITQKKWEEIRSHRNKLLADSDWTQLSDAPVYNLDVWKKYRQNLRDITNSGNPDLIAWPVKPIAVPFPVEAPPPPPTPPDTGETTPLENGI